MQRALERNENHLATLIENEIRQNERQLEVDGEIRQATKEKIDNLHIDISSLQDTWARGEEKLQRITDMGGRILEVGPWFVRREKFNEVHCEFGSAPEDRIGYRQITIDSFFPSLYCCW
jgi:hypothetical protein